MNSRFLGTIQLREPRQIPDINPVSQSFEYLSKANNKSVNIRHPGYDPRYDLLLSLLGLDHAQGGVHFGLVLDACAIIYDNQRDGWLSTNRDGTEKVNGDIDDILSAGDYWYFLKLPIVADSPWPVVTCFRDWQFPSTLPLPHTWQRVPDSPDVIPTAAASDYSAAINTRDLSCRISAHRTGTEAAHICPSGVSDWFLANNMALYNNDGFLPPQSLLDDHKNLLLLRSDLHKAFDDKNFTFYPKDPKSFVLHMMESSVDIGLLYHNVKLHPITQCSREFLYARFAWTIFNCLSRFISSPVDRTVITVKVNDSNRIPIREISTMTSIELQAHEKSMRKRSVSPKKRSRPNAEEEEEEGEEDAKEQVRQDFKRRRYENNSFTSIDCPSLIKEHEHNVSQIHQSPEPTELEDADTYDPRRLQRLRAEFLEKQRPPNFESWKGRAFAETSDAKTVFERLGYEIRDEDFDDCNDYGD